MTNKVVNEMVQNNKIEEVRQLEISIGQIFKTNNYSKFKMLEENRNINQRNYAKLVNSMKKEQLVIPIIVNENYEIIDGQHRYLASKELGLPIYYFVISGYGMDQVIRANLASSNWTKKDFLMSYVQEGKEEYARVYEIINKYDIKVSTFLRVLSTITNVNQKLLSKYFEDGTFKSTDLEKVEEALITLEDFNFFKGYKTKSFVVAFLKLYTHPDYKHEKMLDKLKERKNRLTSRGTSGEYLSLLTKDIYSYGRGQNIFYDETTKKFY